MQDQYWSCMNVRHATLFSLIISTVCTLALATARARRHIFFLVYFCSTSLRKPRQKKNKNYFYINLFFLGKSSAYINFLFNYLFSFGFSLAFFNKIDSYLFYIKKSFFYFCFPSSLLRKERKKLK